MIYIHQYYAEHDKGNTPVCYDEFYNNEWQDGECRAEYMKALTAAEGDSAM